MSEKDRIALDATEALRKFALSIIAPDGDYLTGDLSGDYVEEQALKFGLLEKKIINEPCCDVCLCAEYDADFPTECNRYTDVLKETAATAEANKRIAELKQDRNDLNYKCMERLHKIAELESEVAELKCKLNDYIKITNCQSKEILLIQTKNNVLNNAIRKSLSCVAEEINPNNYNGEILTNFIYDYGRMVDILNEALSATPAESLQALKEVK